MEADGHAEPLGLGPQGVHARVVQVHAVHRVRHHLGGHEPELPHRPTELLRGEAGVVQRQERRRFHALGSRADEVRRPVVPRAAERDGELGLERVDAHHGQRPEEHGDVEPLDVHGLELRRRVEAGGGVLLEDGIRPHLGVRSAAPDRPREGPAIDDPVAHVRLSRLQGTGRSGLVPWVQVTLVEIPRLDDVKVRVQDTEPVSAHGDLLP